MTVEMELVGTSEIAPTNPGRKTALRHWHALVDDVLQGHAGTLWENYFVMSELWSPCRRQWLVRIRQEIWWKARKELRLSFPEIGRRSDGFHHATVMHGIKMHQARIDSGEVS